LFETCSELCSVASTDIVVGQPLIEVADITERFDTYVL
jgi:hypothetical protein